MKTPSKLANGSKSSELPESPRVLKSSVLEPSEIFTHFKAYIKTLQEQIIAAVETLEGQRVKRQTWDFRAEASARKEKRVQEDNEKRSGGGYATLIEGGQFFERAGVNISSVGGMLSEDLARVLKVEVGAYCACGLSVVFHPHSPMVPSVHFNVRLFELAGGKYWFGGGSDLTPYAPFEEDFRYFHGVLKNAVTAVVPARYGEFKRACDEYFYLPHRNEMRGVGGVFFDYLKDDKERDYQLVRSLGDHFIESWFPIAERRKGLVSGGVHKTFQQLRHGRYVEFNLLYDRGTLFGLKTGGRVESIFMSLPRTVLFMNEFPANVAKLAEVMNPYYQARDWGTE